MKTAIIASLSLVAFVSSQSVFLSSDLFGNNGGGLTTTPPPQPSIITLPSDNQISTVANDFGSFTLNLQDIPNLNTPDTSNTESSNETPETTEVSSIFDNINTQPIWTPPTVSEAEAENIVESPVSEESIPPIEITPEQENIPTVIEEAFIEAPPVTFTNENEIVLGEEILVAEDIGNPLDIPVTTNTPTETGPSTVQCSFTADGQILCQTCYYQAGCNDLTTCPIDHCE